MDEGKRFGEAGVGGLVIEANVPKSRICCDLFVAPTNVLLSQDRSLKVCLGRVP